MRGRDPVEISALSNPTLSTPVDAGDLHRVRTDEPRRTADQADALAPQQLDDAVLEVGLDPLDRERERLGVDLGLACSRPMPVERRRKLIAPPVAIIVLEGMQSHRWAAPPMTSRSTIVTLAPSRAE